MKFIPLESMEQLNEIQGAKGYKVIFKHNTNCPISKGVLRKLEMEEAICEDVKEVYYLDLHANRELSNAVAAQFGIEHQSPQILLIKDGQCTYNEWGYDISAEATAAAVHK